MTHVMGEGKALMFTLFLCVCVCDHLELDYSTYELPNMGAENSGSLQEQQLLLIAKLSL